MFVLIFNLIMGIINSVLLCGIAIGMKDKDKYDIIATLSTLIIYL